MNPIYKFELSANGTTQQVFPIYGDSLAKDFELESNEQFYRAKLSGELVFEFDDYSFIVGQAFDERFDIIIYISYDAGGTWTQYWHGEFYKTDCEFDGDAQTVSVKPSVVDEYTAILAGIDKEYNLLDLSPEIWPVKADKRPMIQVYVPGQTSIGCFLSGMWWEQECEAEEDTDKLVNQYYFTLNKTLLVVDVSGNMTPTLPNVFTGVFVNAAFNPLQQGTQEFTNGAYKFVYYYVASAGGSTARWSIVRISDSTTLWKYELLNEVPPSLPNTVSLSPVSGSGATGTVSLYLHNLPVYSRYMCDTDTINGIATYDIPADDIVENNRNYHKVIGYNFPNTIYFSDRLTSTPTQWGIYQPGQYYQEPYLYWLPELFPVARNAWGRISVWFTFDVFDWIVEQSARKAFMVRDAFPLWSVIYVLLGKIDPTLTHAGTTAYSEFLYGTNPVSGITQTLLITPKSNVVSAGYDQPAKKAPVTLREVLNMLRDCFRCYWFIDSSGKFRIEHIKYFRGGGSYSGTPVVGTDLTLQGVTRNGKKWAFARNQYKFDKPEMAARYQFGWMDDVTQMFEGYPIDIKSKYVNPENIEQITIAQFTSDVDYILLNPSAVSKDGFVLMAATNQTIMKSFVWQQGGVRNYSGKPFTTFDSTTRIHTDMMPITGGSLVFAAPAAGYKYLVDCYDADGNLVSNNGFYTTAQTITPVATAKYVALVLGRTNDAAITPDDANALTSSVSGCGYSLPYYNYQDNGDHYLQNAYVAFVLLQQYYAYDMPAREYQINGADYIALGVKKLKNQQLRFPMLNDPNLVQLIKTNLGNGTIKKMSVNLCSRSAETTLIYDTE